MQPPRGVKAAAARALEPGGYNRGGTQTVSRLSAIASDELDLAVIGGGIIGCGIARDAALRGLRVGLVEQRDFGSGTTSASTRIVHGGLRYLEMLDLRLVRLDLRERETLLRTAPHLVEPLEFVIPFSRQIKASPWKLRAGLALYDALSFDKSLPSRRWLSGGEARRLEPALAQAGIEQAAAYHDARVDLPERLALENLIDAAAHGAVVVSYCEATGLIERDGRVRGVRLRDRLDGQPGELTARVIVNATGAWLEPVARRLTARQPDVIRTTKGVHIVCQPLTNHALVLFSQVDGRLLFAIPRAGLTWIGTTDTDFSGDPAEARATRADVEYLVASVGGIFPSLSLADVLYTTAGVRALVRQPGSASSVSRMHAVVDGEPVAPHGMLSVLGGKITGYRAIAEEVTDAVVRRLGLGDRRSVTADMALPGARHVSDGGIDAAVAPAAAAHVAKLYGTRAAGVLALAQARPELAEPLSPRYPDIGAQVVFGVRSEYCLRLSDFMRRRTLLGATDDQGLGAAAPAARLMATELGWSAAREADEIAEYRRDVAATVAFAVQ